MDDRAAAVNRFVELWVTTRAAVAFGLSVVLSFYAAAASAQEQFVVTLPAPVYADAPFDTGIGVAQREYVQIDVFGTISTFPGNMSGPAGAPGQTRHGGYTPAIVIAQVSGHRTAIEGGSRAWTSGQAGTLKLFINDPVTNNNSGAFTVVITKHAPLVGDTDGDGLDDELEDKLLSYFAPHIKFASTEGNFPSTIAYHARMSSIEWHFLNANGGGFARVENSGQVPYYPEWHLGNHASRVRPPGTPGSGDVANNKPAGLIDLFCPPDVAQLIECDPMINAGAVPYNVPIVRWQMGASNSIRSGEPQHLFVESNMGLGLYGRVHKDATSPHIVHVTYFHFYPFSDTDRFLGFEGDFGFHEGDFEFLDIKLDLTQGPAGGCVLNPFDDPADLTLTYADANGTQRSILMCLERVRRVRWWAHGKQIEWRPFGEPCVEPDDSCPDPAKNCCIEGNDGDPEFLAPVAVTASGSWWDKNQDGTGCSFPLEPFPNGIGFPHVDALIQEGGHGFFPIRYRWAFSFGDFCVDQGPIDGLGLSGTPLDVTNVGEVYRPRLGTELAMQYVGRWGSENRENENPRTIPFQSDEGQYWKRHVSVLPLPEHRVAYLGRFSHGYINDVITPAGRISWPHNNLFNGIANEVEELIVYPGAYPVASPVQFDTPTRIVAPHGGVRLGASE